MSGQRGAATTAQRWRPCMRHDQRKPPPGLDVRLCRCCCGTWKTRCPAWQQAATRRCRRQAPSCRTGGAGAAPGRRRSRERARRGSCTRALVPGVVVMCALPPTPPPTAPAGPSSRATPTPWRMFASSQRARKRCTSSGCLGCARGRAVAPAATAASKALGSQPARALPWCSSFVCTWRFARGAGCQRGR